MNRAAILVVTLALPVLAGCLGGNEDPIEPRRYPPVYGVEGYGLSQLDTMLADMPPFMLQLCDYGFRLVAPANASTPGQVATLPGDRSCDFRVTRPLLDPDLFDWQNQHGPANEVSLAVNPTDPLNLIGGAKDYTVSYISNEAGCGQFTVWMGQFWSRDGGRTWGNDLMPGFPGDDRASPLQGNVCNTDPVMVFDSDGTAWFNALNYRGAREDVGDPMNPAGNGGLVTGSQVCFARSDDGGQTYPQITFASYGQNDPGIFNDKNWLAVDPNSDHMIHAWTNFYGVVGIIEFVESFDAGLTWTHPLPLTPGANINGGAAPIGQFSMPQYDSQGNVWVIWNSGGLVVTRANRADPMAPSVFEPTQRMFTFGPGGGGGCMDKTSFRHSVYPVMGIDTTGGERDGRMYVTWASRDGQNSTVFVAYSDDPLNPGTWTVAPITAGLADDQFMPWLDVGPDGTVHVAYYDCSIDPGGRNMTFAYSYSLDGGSSWQGPLHIGQAAFDGDLGHHQSGVPFIGDYNAVDASTTGVHFFWADTRHGRSDVYAATLVRDWDAAAMYAGELWAE